MLYRLVFAGLLIFPFAAQAEKLIKLPKNLDALREPGDRLDFSLKTKRLGALRFELWLNPISKSPSDRFYRGTVRHLGQETAVAGALIANSFELQFYGRRIKNRNPRVTTIKIKLDSPNESYLSQVSTHKASTCGTLAPKQLLKFRRAATRALPLTPMRYLEISTDADVQYYKEYRNRTLRRILSILNAVDVLYMNQVGVKLNIVNQHVFPSKQNPYKTSGSFALLNTFKSYTLENNHLGNADVYMLFTGKKLKQSIIGLAFVGKICKDNTDSYGLVQRVNNSIQSLVAAHELGHLFGATHPEDTLSNPDPSLMTGIVKSANTRLSSFSLNQIDSHLNANNACLSTSNGRSLDLALDFKPLSNQIEIGSYMSDFGSYSNCMFEVQAASKFSKLLRFNGTVLAMDTLGDAHNLAIVDWPNTQKRRSKLFVRQRVVCDAGTIVSSDIKKLRVPGKNRRKINQSLRSFR